MRLLGLGGDLPAPEHEQAGGGAQDLPLPPRRPRDRTGQPGVVWGRQLYPMAKGFLYLVVVMDWVSRAVLAWRLSNPLGADFLCRGARGSALQLWPA